MNARYFLLILICCFGIELKSQRIADRSGFIVTQSQDTLRGYVLLGYRIFSNEYGRD